MWRARRCCVERSTVAIGILLDDPPLSPGPRRRSRRMACSVCDRYSLGQKRQPEEWYANRALGGEATGGPVDVERVVVVWNAPLLPSGPSLAIRLCHWALGDEATGGSVVYATRIP